MAAASSSSTDATESTARKSPNDAVSESCNSIPTLPSDILEEFIARLPLRSLIISTSVCKSWYALLKNPYFASKHFQHTAAHTYFLFRRRQSVLTAGDTISIVSSTESFENIPINIFNNIPFLQNSSLGLRISGSCNGLVCLSAGDEASIIILWNPVTRIFKALPLSPVKRPNRRAWDVTLGFGFDPVSNDFKLLRIVHYGYGEHYQVDIYSLSTNCWREIQPPQGFVIYQNSASMVVVNGRFHWKAIKIEGLDTGIGGELIVTFDVSKEVFTHIKLPSLFGIVNERLDDDSDDDDDDDDEQLGWELVAWKEDFLGLIIYPKTCAGRYFDMWVLDEYGVEKSWSKHFTFGPHTDVVKPLVCKSNGEILLYKDNGQLVVYDSATRTFKIVHVQGNPFRREVFNYVGSLLPIEGGSTIEEANLAAVEPDPSFVR